MGERLLMFEILLQGIGVLISWNAILTSLDWLNSLYPSYNVGIVFALLYISPVLIFQPLTTIKGNKLSYNFRLVSSYITATIVLTLIPILGSLLPERLGFVIISVMITLVGIAGSVAQVTILGLGGTLPNKYTNLIMIGSSIAGILTSVLRLICLGAFTDVEDGLMYSSLVYYVSAGVVVLICILAQIHLMKNPIVVFCLDSVTPSPVRLLDDEGRDDDFVSRNADIDSFSWKSLFGYIWEYLILVWTVFFVTFAMLTHVALATEIPSMSYSYFETLLIFDFNLFDCIGRYFCAIYSLKKFSLWILTLFRFGFWATFILIASQNPYWIFSATWFKFLNMAVYAFTNGYFSTLCMIMGPAACPNTMKDRAGYTMAGGLAFGIFSGTLMAFAFSGVGEIPSD